MVGRWKGCSPFGYCSGRALLVVVGTCLSGPASDFVIVAVIVGAVPSGKADVGKWVVGGVGVWGSLTSVWFVVRVHWHAVRLGLLSVVYQDSMCLPRTSTLRGFLGASTTREVPWFWRGVVNLGLFLSTPTNTLTGSDLLWPASHYHKRQNPGALAFLEHD